MSVTENSNATDKSIKVNIYGCSAAGKTTFLYELIRQLCPEGRCDDPQEPRVRINEKTENFRNATKEKLGDKKSISTWKESEGIEISIRNDFFGGGATGTRLIQSWQLNDWITLTFHDVRGEEIRKLLDDAKANPEAKKKIEQVLKDCQCFLFFFDPTYSDPPKGGPDVNAFYEGEIRQASALLEHVPECRPQDPLPILFIQTHRDVLEKKTDDDKQRAERWFEDVLTHLEQKYEDGYGREKDGSNQLVRRAILDRKKNRFQVNSLNKGDVFGPLKRICEIKDQVKPKIVSGFPVGIIVAILAMIITIAVLIFVWNPPANNDSTQTNGDAMTNGQVSLTRDEQEKIDAAKRSIRDKIDREPTNMRETITQVEKFIKTFGGKIAATDKENMILAVNLAKRFLEENEYTVASMQYGGFAAPRSMGLVVTVDGKERLSARTNGKLTEATYRTPFTFQWKFDQPIRIELKANVGWLGEDMKLAALAELKDVEAVNLLRGKTIVLPATTDSYDWKNYTSGGYFIWCKIQGIPNDKWMAFEKYISPGNYWKPTQ